MERLVNVVIEIEVWQAAVEDHDQESRDLIVTSYLPVVRRVVGKMKRSLPAHVDVDDLFSYGVFGLIRAMDHYRYGGPVAFETYAVPSIRGLVLDELRTLDWAPRSLRRKQRDIDKAVEILDAMMGCTPTDAEVADYLQIPYREVVQTRQATVASTAMSLDERHSDPWHGPTSDANSKYDVIEGLAIADPALAWAALAAKEAISEMMHKSTLQDQLILTLYYFEGLTLAEVGAVVGIPESRVSTVHTRTMKSLRGSLRELLAS